MSSSASDLLAHLATLSTTEKQKEFLGDKLFPLILQRVTDPDLTSKVTGMLLELENDEICRLLESEEAFNTKVNEGLTEIKSCEPQ